MSDNLFDNGIDGEPIENEEFEDDVYYDGGIYLFRDKKENISIMYFVGQYNDNNMDPDSIVIDCDEYRVQIDDNRIYIRTPGKNFDLPLTMQLTDFVQVQSPVNIVVNKTNIDDLVEARDRKTLKIIVSKEEIQRKIKRLENLLVFS